MLWLATFGLSIPLIIRGFLDFALIFNIDYCTKFHKYMLDHDW